MDFITDTIKSGLDFGTLDLIYKVTTLKTVLKISIFSIQSSELFSGLVLTSFA